MLHKTTDVILPETLDLLQRLQQDPALDGFILVGGTSLALQIGHRFSIDLDLFTMEPFDTHLLSEHITVHYAFQLSAVAKNTLLGVMEGVKVDFITHAYPLVKPIINEDGLRLASCEDIGAMKLNAIGHSGQRLKDFIDIYYLLERMPLSALLEAYSSKYAHSNILIPLKGLSYFEDIDLEADPPIMNKTLQPDIMKKRLLEAVEYPDRVF